MITNPSSGTNVHEIAAGIYRINTRVSIPNGPGRFSFNQYLIADEEPLVFPYRAAEDGEEFRRHMDYYAHSPDSGGMLERLAKENPRTLACMHGSAWRGDGAALLRALARSLQNYSRT